MAFIHCCGALRKTKTFVCTAPEGFIYQQVDFLRVCPNCKNFVLQVTRIDAMSRVSTFRRTNNKARELFDKLRASILFELKNASAQRSSGSRSYLSYSEFGVKKRCYSSLSALKIGLFENYDLPVSDRFAGILRASPSQ